jgi:hypothetical protein
MGRTGRFDPSAGVEKPMMSRGITAVAEAKTLNPENPRALEKSWESGHSWRPFDG